MCFVERRKESVARLRGAHRAARSLEKSCRMRRQAQSKAPAPCLARCAARPRRARRLAAVAPDANCRPCREPLSRIPPGRVDTPPSSGGFSRCHRALAISAMVVSSSPLEREKHEHAQREVRIDRQPHFSLSIAAWLASGQKHVFSILLYERNHVTRIHVMGTWEKMSDNDILAALKTGDRSRARHQYR